MIITFSLDVVLGGELTAVTVTAEVELPIPPSYADPGDPGTSQLLKVVDAGGRDVLWMVDEGLLLDKALLYARRKEQT